MSMPNSIRRLLSSWQKHVCCRKGFTLLELLVVMVVSAILLTMAVISVQSIVRHHAPEELVSELHVARMSAIRQHRPVTVTFNFNTTQCAVTWTMDGGGVGTRIVDLGSQGEQFAFDNNPPGAPPAADSAFVFSPLGFISTIPGGNTGGNIYLRNQSSGVAAGVGDRSFYQIQTTIAGGIVLNRYNPSDNTWIRAY
jgi:prepilin-type N-terminal cleavage/methylation domain-containing protein